MYAVDCGGRIICWNRAAEALFGRIGANALGRPCCEVVAGRLPSGKRLCTAQCQIRRRAGRATGVRDFDMVARGADGRFTMLRVSTVGLPDSGAGSCTVHVVRPRPSHVNHQISNASAAIGDLSIVTRREVEVLRGLARGQAPKQIAESLFISPLTVRSHLRNLFRKLNVRSQVQLTICALRSGLS